MDAFGDDSDFTAVPAAGESVPSSDPAADFLAREQAELGEDLGQELGLESTTAASTAPQVVLDEAPTMVDTEPISNGMENMGIDSAEGRSSPRFVMPPRPKEEPETIKKWREEQEMRLKEKDEAEQVKMNELREQAKKELDDWYKHYEEQLNKTKVTNRESEKEFVAEINDIRPGSEWERVNKLVDFNTKANKNTKDMSRMRSIMLQLKQNPPIKNAE